MSIDSASIGSTTGRVLTITAKVAGADSAFDPPLSSVAATSIVASPARTPVSVSSVPDTSTVATAASLVCAASACV